MSGKYCQIQLTCATRAEADKISNTLLVKQLVACVRQVSTNSAFRWQGKIDQVQEILLIMESRLDLFDKIEQEVAKLHSYKTFVLEAVPVEKMSSSASSWLTEELK